MCFLMKALIPSVSVNPSGSDLSLDVETERKKEKKTVKDKLTGMFKRNPSSRTGRYAKHSNVSSSSVFNYFL